MILFWNHLLRIINNYTKHHTSQKTHSLNTRQKQYGRDIRFQSDLRSRVVSTHKLIKIKPVQETAGKQLTSLLGAQTPVRFRRVQFDQQTIKEY